MVLTPQDQAKWADVSDDDARKVFETTKARYETAEKRHVLQMVFPNADEANAARAKLTGGLSFEDLAKERGLSAADYDLGTVTKSGILDPAVAEAAFALPENEVSQPIQGRFGYCADQGREDRTRRRRILRQGGAVDQERDRARARARRGARPAQQDGRRARRRRERHRGGQEGRPAVHDHRGDGPVGPRAGRRSGRPACRRPSIIVTPVFSADVGSDNDPLQINRGPGDSGYVWYDVLGITPSRERTLDEVKDRVAARWRDDQIEKRLRAKTDEMVEQLKEGGKLADLAQAAGLKVETATSFKRGANVPGMSAAGVEAVFVANKGEAGTGRRRAGRPARGLCRHRHRRAEDRSRLGPRPRRCGTTCKRTAADEQLNQFVGKLEQDFGTQINATAFAASDRGGAGGELSRGARLICRAHRFSSPPENAL